MLVFSEGKKEITAKNQKIATLAKNLFVVNIFFLFVATFALGMGTGEQNITYTFIAFVFVIVSLIHLAILGYYVLKPQKRLISFVLMSMMFSVSFIVFLRSLDKVIYDIKYIVNENKIQTEYNAQHQAIVDKIDNKTGVVKDVTLDSNLLTLTLENGLKVQPIDFQYKELDPSNTNFQNMSKDEFEEYIRQKNIKFSMLADKFKKALVGQIIVTKIDPDVTYYARNYMAMEKTDTYWVHIYLNGQLVDINLINNI